MILMGIFAAYYSLFCAGSSAQSVAQQCLTEQIRNNVNNDNNDNDNAQNRQNAAPEDITMAAFDSICRNYDSYTECFERRLPQSNQPADRFLRLVFSQRDMNRAYTGLCTQDLEELRGNIRCLLSTPEVRRCYDTFNRGVNQVVNLQNRNQLPFATLEELACNVSVTRYRCETAVYSFCNEDAGGIMQDFFFAGVPDSCREGTGVTSRYVDLFNAGTTVMSHSSLIMTTMLLLLVSLLQNS